MGIGSFFKSIAGAIIPAVIAYFTGGIGAALFTVAMAGVSGLLAKKPPQGDGWTTEMRDNLVSVRQSDAPHQIIYGERRVGGALTFIHTAGANNEFMYMVDTLAGHQVAAVGDPYFDGVRVPLDGNGDATGTYAGHVHVEKNLGTPAQAAFAGLMAALPDMWTSAHRQIGRTGCYLRLKYNPSLFPNGVPNITFDVRGKCDIYDPRSGLTGYSNNAILCAANFLCDPTYSFGAVVLSEIDLGVLSDSADDCDAMIGVVVLQVNVTAAGDILTLAYEPARMRRGDGVTFSSDGYLPAPLVAETLYHWIPLTPTTGKVAAYLEDALDGVAIALTDSGAGGHAMHRVREPRYTANGVFEASSPDKGVEALLSASAGRATNIGGKWQFLSGRYIAPTIELTESDLRDSYDVAARKSRRDIFNGVKGTYSSPENAWQPSDFPAVTPAAYLAEDDNERIWSDVSFPMTTSASACQRIATIELARVRQQVSLDLKCKLSAYRVQAGNTITLSLSAMGWESKPFEVAQSRLVLFDDGSGMPALGVDLALRETDPTVYAWDEATQEGVVDISPATNLTVTTPQVSGLVVDPGTYYNFGSLTPTWNVTNEPFVRHYQFEGRFEAETQFAVMGTPDARRLVLNNAFLSGTWYFRVKAIGADGAVSDYAPSDAGLAVEIGAPSVMPRVTGLELRGDGGNSTAFEGNDVKVVWRESSQTLSYELGDEPQGAGSGARDLYFKDFEVRIKDPVSGETVRTEHTLDPRYDYTFEKNAEDYAAFNGTPGAWRTVKLEVYQRGQQNQISGIPARLTVSNPPPPLPNDVAITADHHHIVYRGLIPPGALDWGGALLYISEIEDFDADDVDPIDVGRAELFAVPLDPATDYFVRIRSYDSFGKIGLNESGQYAVTTGQFGTTFIADGAIVRAKIGLLAVDNARVESMTAGKITTDTLDVGTAITVRDTQASPRTRAVFGKLGALSTDYGINIYDSAGNLIVGASGLGLTVVGTANIADANITTLKVAGNAIVIGGSASWGGGSIVDSNLATWTQILSLTYTSQGNPLTIDFGLAARCTTTTYQVHARVKRDGAVIWSSHPGDAWLTGPLGPDFASKKDGALDDTTAGAHTYTIDVTTSNPGSGAFTDFANVLMLIRETLR